MGRGWLDMGGWWDLARADGGQWAGWTVDVARIEDEDEDEDVDGTDADSRITSPRGGGLLWSWELGAGSSTEGLGLGLSVWAIFLPSGGSRQGRTSWLAPAVP